MRADDPGVAGSRGRNEANLDTMVGVIRVKLPSGYSGDLCSTGSREYVTFWADFNNNGIFETCLGTTSVDVHDIQKIPKEGLEYAVFLPVDLSKHRRPCEEGPVVVRVRAILSWQVAPTCFNPNYVPVWGNRLETLIHIQPGITELQGTHFPIIQSVGSMDVGDIDPITGLANGAAVLAGFTAQDSPFGDELIITGHIGNAPDISSGANKLKYQVEISDDGGLNWHRVMRLTSRWIRPLRQKCRPLSALILAWINPSWDVICPIWEGCCVVIWACR